ncbi:MAG TPA: hypothetical protein VF857_02210 [Spirochaetota bacterium]
MTCATAQQKEQTANPPDKYDVLQYATEDSRYNKYLVTIESYTTNGSTYHKKYLQYLYGIAKIFVDEKKIAVGEHSIGFYYDKKENRKDKLYLGVDLILPDEMVSQEASYDKNARALIGKNLREMMSVLSSCTEVLKENEVKGVVVGLVWKRNGLRELVNIWISKDDVDLFYRNELTLNELVIRSTVTNTDGRIIRMTL